MTQTQTDDPKKVYGYLKILDEGIASALELRGFSFISEKINGGVPVYCFEVTPELLAAIADMVSEDDAPPVEYAEEDTIRF